MDITSYNCSQSKKRGNYATIECPTKVAVGEQNGFAKRLPLPAVCQYCATVDDMVTDASQYEYLSNYFYV